MSVVLCALHLATVRVDRKEFPQKSGSWWENGWISWLSLFGLISVCHLGLYGPIWYLPVQRALIDKPLYG